MKNKITIIGGGLAGWANASVFSNNGYLVDIFEKKMKALVLNKYPQTVG